MFRVSSLNLAASSERAFRLYWWKAKNIMAQSADFCQGRWCVISLFCRPDGTTAAQTSPQRATISVKVKKKKKKKEHWCVWSAKSVKTFCRGSELLLCVCCSEWRWREDTAMALRRLKSIWHTLCCAQSSLNTLQGCLRGQHNLRFSVDVTYHGQSQRAQCDNVTSHGGY